MSSRKKERDDEPELGIAYVVPWSIGNPTQRHVGSVFRRGVSVVCVRIGDRAIDLDASKAEEFAKAILDIAEAIKT